MSALFSVVDFSCITPWVPGECWATLHITSSSPSSMVGNVEISSDGMLLVRLTGIHMRLSQVPDGAPDDVDDNVTYDVIWEPSNITANGSNGSNGHDLKHQKVLLCCHEDRAIDVQRIIPWENCRCVDIKEVEEVLRCLALFGKGTDFKTYHDKNPDT